MSKTSWGIVSTIKAPTREVLQFAAYHLELGAAHLFLYLDDCNAETAAILNAHPNITAVLTDQAYWTDLVGKMPAKHQVRQTRNATHCYAHQSKVDWLAHIDVDEFLVLNQPMSDILDKAEKNVLRVAPFESLCREDTDDADTIYCKAKLPNGPKGDVLAQEIYPQFGAFFKSAFVSHTAGKIFVKAGLPDIEIRIHRAFDSSKTALPDQDIPDTELCHLHVQSWEKWLKIMTFRLSKGSYRSELEQSLPLGSGRMSRHNLFSALTSEGTEDLRAFFEEVCLASPALLKKLNTHGLLRAYNLNLQTHLQKHFPDFQG